jgi:hypothetical protein
VAEPRRRGPFEAAISSLLEVEGILAIGSLIVFASALGTVLFETIPTENEKYAMLMLGALIGIVKDTFGRYFQATKGAQDQRKEAAEVTKALAAQVAPVDPTKPAKVEVTNDAANPVPTTDAPDADPFRIKP